MAGHIAPSVRKQRETKADTSLSPFSAESLAQELLQPKFIVIVKKFVSMVIVNPIRFTVKTNHVDSLQSNWHLCHQVLHVWKGGSRSIILVVVKADHTVPCELLFSSW